MTSLPTSCARSLTSSLTIAFGKNGALCSAGLFARHGRAIQLAAMTLIIVIRLVHAQSVVPGHQHIRFPAEPAAEGRLRDVLAEIAQDRRGLLSFHALDADRVRRVDVQRLLPAFRMRAHHRMSV